MDMIREDVGERKSNLREYRLVEGDSPEKENALSDMIFLGTQKSNSYVGQPYCQICLSKGSESGPYFDITTPKGANLFRSEGYVRVKVLSLRGDPDSKEGMLIRNWVEIDTLQQVSRILVESRSLNLVTLNGSKGLVRELL